jgi:hypothetical protein
MKKLFSFLFISVILVSGAKAVLAGPGQAGNFRGSATTYRVTISKIEVSQDNSTWVTLGEGTQTFDIASVNVGAQVGNYVTDKPIPAGTYKYIRITISRTMVINGSATNAGVTYYTTGNKLPISGGNLGIGSSVVGQRADATIVIPSEAPSPDPRETLEISGNNLIVTRVLEEPFTVAPGGGTLEVNFNTQSTIEFDPNENALPNPAFYPIPPSVTIDFN